MCQRLLLVLAGCACLAVGCSSSNTRPGSKVTGKVTMNGSPVSGAKVIFTDGKDGGGTVNGPTAISDESGEYVMIGVKPGDYKVVVYKLVPRKGAVLPAEGEGMDLEQMEASGIGSHALPAKYSRPATTTLTAHVESGTNKDVNLELKGEGKAQ
jgi:hypothetical protein